MRRQQLLRLLQFLPLIAEALPSVEDRDQGIGQCPLPSPWGYLTTETACPAPLNAPENITDSLKADDTATVDGFVSFEEWKKVKFAEKENTVPSLNVSRSNDSDEPDEGTGRSNAKVHEVVLPGSSSGPEGRPRPQILSYNFASPDCSARVQSSSPQTQHASSLLSKSRDKYMLTPCKADQHWVVIELCDEIRVEAVQISMWEFFSGIIKDVRLSGGNDDGDGDDLGFVEIGNFTTKNARGSQTFFLPSPTPFHRFLRLDFASYYGTEYYCPVSQVKVFGMNQLDAFRWEQKKGTPVVVTERKRIEEVAAASLPKLEVNLPGDGSLERLLAQSNLTSENSSTTSSSSLTEAAVPSAGSGESIYALIVRRLSALEGNTTLIARYIEEQSGMMMNRVERKWAEWRDKRDLEEVVERMRMEDRMGSILSQLEQQRATSTLMQTQLRLLTDELTYERRRGLAQLVVMIFAILLVALSRSSVVQQLLAPLTENGRRSRVPSFRAFTRNVPLEQRIRRPETPPTPTFGTVRRRHASASVRISAEHGGRPRSSMPMKSPRQLGRHAHLHPLVTNKRAMHSVSPPRSADEASEVVESDSDTNAGFETDTAGKNTAQAPPTSELKYA
ncbi:UNC-like C-terminal-domain-containing protein [Kockovaella imperatae]|uniref:UNC-like C-terminal-domain-containing protein n=1 Tax=Kockovaella imperatae TaxID=4999 RepID=A0A1Y1UCH8_9TREE|nr:UNC-like C-terminal-domain-containing protein [Kockovaella imperatae]ORX35750.1 UNC-like C-terminal-domain-containing protein [Kockovaella imperatae]